MAITKGAKKALRSSMRKRVFNIRRKRAYTEVLKEIEALLKAGKVKEVKAKLPVAYKLIDKAAKMNTIKKNNASRKKSRLMAKVKKVESK